MNERIQQLAEQAGWGKGETHDDCMQCSPFDKEKFAELIVKECMTNLYLNGYDDAVLQIQKHFGVEE